MLMKIILFTLGFYTGIVVFAIICMARENKNKMGDK